MSGAAHHRRPTGLSAEQHFLLACGASDTASAVDLAAGSSGPIPPSVVCREAGRALGEGRRDLALRLLQVVQAAPGGAAAVRGDPAAAALLSAAGGAKWG